MSESFVKMLSQLRNIVMFNFWGPPLLPMRYIVNAFKALTLFYVLALIYITGNDSPPMLLYLFLHGTYGLFWLAKDIFFPDATFQRKASFGSLIFLTIFLLGYWMIPVPLALWGEHFISWSKSCMIVLIYFIGLWLMLGSDYQKNTTLLKRKGLISDGYFKLTRNPNYLGETFVYGSFAACANNWYGYAYVFGIAFILLFCTNMFLKDKLSLRLKPGWDVYQKHSYMFFPKIFQSHYVNYVLYIFFGTLLYLALK